MRSCEQTRGMTILDHGIGVHRSWKEVLSGAPPEGLELWWPKLLSEVGGYSALDIEEYHIYHDCGKPLCLMIDAEGRRHFPDHARVSYEAYLGAGGKPEIAEWILHDMDIHTCSAADLEGFG